MCGAERRLLGAVDPRDGDVITSVQLLRHLVPRRSQALTVSAPTREEHTELCPCANASRCADCSTGPVNKFHGTRRSGHPHPPTKTGTASDKPDTYENPPELKACATRGLEETSPAWEYSGKRTHAHAHTHTSPNLIKSNSAMQTENHAFEHFKHIARLMNAHE